jgi:hypothetical protein
MPALIADFYFPYPDSPSPEAFLPLKIKGGRTRTSGMKKNPVLLLILKIM